MSKWIKGQSGNKNGRPPKGGAFSEECRQVIEEIFGDRLGVVRAIAAMARAGDLQALQVLLSRTVPPLRPVHDPVSVISESELATMPASQVAAEITSAAVQGRLSADVANMLLDGLQKQYQITESTELAERLAELESKIQQQGKH